MRELPMRLPTARTHARLDFVYEFPFNLGTGSLAMRVPPAHGHGHREARETVQLAQEPRPPWAAGVRCEPRAPERFEARRARRAE